MNPITFPNLGLAFTISPIAFSIFGISVHWYGIIIVSGILLAVFLAKRHSNRNGVSWEDATDFLLWAAFVGVICARLYFIIFKWDYYQNHLDEIVQVRNGRACYLWRNYRGYFDSLCLLP